MDSKILFTILSTLVVVAMGNDAELQIIQSNGQFANRLYKILSEQSGNVFFSPLSAHAVLSLSYLGASGSTEKAYAKSLALPDKNITAEGYQVVSNKLTGETNIALYLANKIYVANDIKLKDQFLKAAKENFNAEVQNLNFAANTEAANAINSWVDQKTEHKIKEIFSPNDLSELTKVVLVNAIYFKGNWKEQFNKRLTKTEPFYLNANDKIDVQMMHQYEESYGFKYDDSLKSKILEMPFKNGNFSMVIILPDEKDGIKDLEAKLQTADLTKITDGLERSAVNLALPKFKIETTIQLNEPLNKLGLGEIFSDTADFGDLAENVNGLKVDKVVQKAYIEVNEEGAEAAAATGISFSNHIAPLRMYFLADHPFMVLLQHKTKVLFYGRVSHPVSGDGHIAPKGKPVKDPRSHNINIRL